MRGQNSKTLHGILATILILVLFMGMIPLHAQAARTASMYKVIGSGSSVVVWNENLSDYGAISNTITVQVVSGTRYDIVIPSESDGASSAVCAANQGKGMGYQTSSFFKPSPNSNRGMLLWIRVRSGKVRLRIDSTSNSGNTSCLKAYVVKGEPISFYEVAKKKSANFLLSTDLARIPLLMCGTNGTKVKRVLSAATNTYELYNFSVSSLTCTTYRNGKKTKTQKYAYQSEISSMGNSYKVAYVQMIPSSVTRKSGEMQTTRGAAMYGAFHLTNQGIQTEWAQASDLMQDNVDWMEIWEDDRNPAWCAESGSDLIWDEVDTGFDDWDDDLDLSYAAAKTARDGAIVIKVGNFYEEYYYDTFVVLYESGGGTGEMFSQTVDEGTDFYLPDCSFEPPSGMVFKEWSVKVGDAEPVSRQPGQRVKADGHIVATAVWMQENQTWTVSFEPGEGSGAMDALSMKSGELCTLPACTYTAPSGKIFANWLVKTGNSDPVARMAGNQITVTSDVTVTAIWQEAPRFKSVALELNGILNLRFYVVYPDAYQAVDDKAVFTIKDNTPITVPYVDGVIDGTRRYFICPVNAYQMADPIKAEYYHDGVLVSQVMYTVQRNLNAILSEKANSDEVTRKLAIATMDYGSYIQPYLAEINQWELSEGGDHVPMMPYQNNLPSDGNPAENYSRTWLERNTDLLDYAQYFLTLDAGTTFHVQIHLKEGVAGKVTGGVNIEGNQASPVDLGDGLWEITLYNLPATALGKTYIFSFYLDADSMEQTVTRMELSPMYYVNLVMKQSDDLMERRAMQALYNYADAAKLYADFWYGEKE